MLTRKIFSIEEAEEGGDNHKTMPLFWEGGGRKPHNNNNYMHTAQKMIIIAKHSMLFIERY